MRYAIKITAVLLAAVLFTQCKKDLLVTVPNDRISTAIYWKTEQDAVLASNAIYVFLSESSTHFFSWDGMTDIGFTHAPQSDESFILQGQFDALNDRVSGDWANAYAGIRAANSFLAHVDQVDATDQDLIDRLKAEVRVLRAYFYIRLASLYGDVPLVTKEITLDESRQLTRAPVGQIWDFVSAELSAAAPMLPVTQKDVGRVTKGAALGLLARAMLYAGRYQQAVDAATEVMGLNTYALYPSYEKLFSYEAENNPEVILDIQFIRDLRANNNFNLLAPLSQNGRSLYVPTKKMVDAYDMTNGQAINSPGSGFDPKNPYENRDPRLGYSVFLPGDELPDGSIFDPRPDSKTGDAVGSTFIVSPTGFNLKKYVDKEDMAQPSNGGLNIILLRYAEILLTYAEAKIELNQLDASVYDAINAVRGRADVNMPPIPDGRTQDELRQIIRHERLVELAFEGQRFFDIRRWRIAAQVMPGKVQGMTYVDNQGDLQTVEVPGWTNVFVDRNYLWPIPQKERDLNPQLTQNPDW